MKKNFIFTFVWRFFSRWIGAVVSVVHVIGELKLIISYIFTEVGCVCLEEIVNKTNAIFI